MLILSHLQNTILFMLCTFAMIFARLKVENYAGGGTTSFVDSEHVVSLTTESMLRCSIICTATEGCCTIRYEKSGKQCQLNFDCCPRIKEEGNGNDIVLQKIPLNENPRKGPPQDCSDFPVGSPPGVYTIYPGTGKELQVYCEDGWTVFQRRKDGTPSFVRSWEDYKIGFGDIRSDHWLGNDNIHLLTNNNKMCGRKLKIVLTDWNNEVREAVYNIFHISDELSKYRLYARGGSGNLYELSTKDYLGEICNYAFSTPDQDNDDYYGHCAQDRQAGWWYEACSGCCLNGRIQEGLDSWESMYWYGWKDTSSLKTSFMLLK